MLSQMLVEIKHEAIRIISCVQVQQEDRTEELERQRRGELARQIGQSAETDKYPSPLFCQRVDKGLFIF